MIIPYFTHLLILIGIFLILALSLQLSYGYSGILNLGHISFFGVGSYVSALLSINGIPFLLSILASGIISGFFGYLLSLPVNKLKGDYFIIITLGFSFVIYAILINWIEITNGPFGLSNIPRPNIFGYNCYNNISFLFLVIFFLLISYFLIHRICTSPYGILLEAVRDDELAVRSLGKNTFKIKGISLTISGFFAGVAGCLYVSYIAFIDPSSFTFVNFMPILLIVTIGGLASLKGTVYATIMIILFPEILRFIGLPSSILGPMRQIIFALMLIIIINFKPRGLFGKVDLNNLC
jgi:branched-chain amino acid transport system permease protein